MENVWPNHVSLSKGKILHAPKGFEKGVAFKNRRGKKEERKKDETNTQII